VDRPQNGTKIAEISIEAAQLEDAMGITGNDVAELKRPASAGPGEAGPGEAGPGEAGPGEAGRVEAGRVEAGRVEAEPAVLVISSRNYSSWSLRGWLLLRLSGVGFRVERVSNDDLVARAELLQQTSSVRIPSLNHQGVEVWGVLAIAEYLAELRPEAGLLPADPAARALCRAISGEMHSGFTALRSALPVNLHAFRPNFPLWSGVKADIARITEIWRECLAEYGGPFLFGARMSLADAMFAPVCTRFSTYDVDLDPVSEAYRAHIMGLADMGAWIVEARAEPELVSELEVDGEF
jgi:glutathione S-transferase